MTYPAHPTYPSPPLTPSAVADLDERLVRIPDPHSRADLPPAARSIPQAPRKAPSDTPPPARSVPARMHPSVSQTGEQSGRAMGEGPCSPSLLNSPTATTRNAALAHLR